MPAVQMRLQLQILLTLKHTVGSAYEIREI
jgi:hypothetical protein